MRYLRPFSSDASNTLVLASKHPLLVDFAIAAGVGDLENTGARTAGRQLGASHTVKHLPPR